MHPSHSATWFLFSGPPPCGASSRCPWAACSPPWCHWCPSAGSCCCASDDRAVAVSGNTCYLLLPARCSQGQCLLYLYTTEQQLCFPITWKAFRLLSPHVLIRFLWIWDIEPLIFTLSFRNRKDFTISDSHCSCAMCHVVASSNFEKSSPRYLDI